MGCQIFKDVHEFQEDEILNMSEISKEKLIKLEKGGSIICTKIGNIQYGMPPETVKDSINQGIQVPEYYIIPSQTFDWAKGINLMEFEFPVYFNFFVRKKTKTKLICEEHVKKQIEIIFQETLLGPKNFDNFDQEFAQGYKPKPDLQKELKHFAVNPFEPTKPLKLEMFLEFIIFDSKNQVQIQKQIEVDEQKKNCTIKIAKNQTCFMVFQDNEFLSKFEDKVEIHQKKFSVYQKVSSRDLTLQNDKFKPPAFGFTMLGSSHGFDACGSTSGFILWINKKGIMIDPPPFSSQALRNNGIPPNLIEKIIITHCHADHDAGVFQKIIEATQVEFMTTQTIMNSFLRKYSAISNIEIKNLKKLFQYRNIKIGHPIFISGARFSFSYAFHSIPCLRFEVEFLNKKFYFSSDTFYNPEALQKIYEKGIFSKERFEDLSNLDFTKYDVILHEAGIPPIHTPTSVLQKLPESVKKNLYLYHIAEKDIEKGLKRALVGLQHTIVIVQENKDRNKIVENLDLLYSVELIHWVPFNRIIEIIEIFEEKEYKPGDIIINEGTVGSKFYIVKEGEVIIFSEDPNNYFQKSSFRGDYFGESALIGNGARLATVKAIKPTILLEIESQDFLWTFDYDTQDNPKYSISPLKMIKNLSDIRQKKNSEFINYNKIIEKMTEAQKCMINMFLKEVNVLENQILWKKGGDPQFCVFAFEGNLELKLPLNIMPLDNQIEKGTLIGDFPKLLKNKNCVSSLVCKSDGIIYVLYKKYLNEFLLQYPGIKILLQDSYLLK